MSSFIDFSYIVASVLFIFGIKMLSKPDTARRGNLVSALGMFIAVGVTVFQESVVTYEWILLGVGVGTLIGVLTSKFVKMTSMPEMVALFNGSGGIASLFVGWAEYRSYLTPSLEKASSLGDFASRAFKVLSHSDLNPVTSISIYLACLIGGVTFSGSVVAYLKLSEKIDGKPVLFRGQQFFNALIVLGLLGIGVLFTLNPLHSEGPFLFSLGLSILFGVMAVIPIGGADMPVVISLLNSYSGLAACAAGFVILNNVLIVAGALVGASGLILTNIMCRAMNRSLSNVLFSGFGAVTGQTGSQGVGYQGEAKPASVEDVYLMLEAAQSVVIVPGYGMAVAQAQHAVRELGELLESNGAEVKYAIHPVAGRMPGHMNVLLAEANVPYEQLVVPDDVNPTMGSIDISIVIGANDVVNPAAREDKNSPLYGMPIINVDQAKVCIVLKRSLKPGFAGVDNPLFFGENTRMLFGDAKSSLTELVAKFKE